MSNTRTGRRMLVGLGVAFTSLAAADAGEPQGLQPGARVRVWAHEASPGGEAVATRVTGRLVGIDDLVLRLETSNDHPPVVVSRRDVQKVEVSLRRGHRRKGALIGLGVGAVVAIVLMAADREEVSSTCDPQVDYWCIDFDLDTSGPEWYAAGAFVLGAAGAGLGALVAPGEKWEVVPSDRLRLAVGPARGGGFRFGVSLAF